MGRNDGREGKNACLSLDNASGIPIFYHLLALVDEDHGIDLRVIVRVRSTAIVAMMAVCRALCPRSSLILAGAANIRLIRFNRLDVERIRSSKRHIGPGSDRRESPRSCRCVSNKGRPVYRR